VRVKLFLQALLVLMALPVAAQVKVGDVSTKLNGTVSAGYTADFGNLTASDHGWTVGGMANLSGYYYNPNFLSFSVSPYLNQSRSNSNFQSISDASGVNANLNLFSGTVFPGSMSYSKEYNSDGSYNVPGLANYVTHGNSDALGVGWSATVPKMPTLMADFEKGSSSYSVYGTNDQGSSNFNSFSVRSGYHIDGFNMGAFYLRGAANAGIPEVLTQVAETSTNSSNTAYGYNLTHRLPLQGSFSASATRSGWNSDYQGNTTNGTIDLVNASVSLHPLPRLGFSGSVSYSDNLSGQLVQAVISAGGSVPGLNTNEASNSLDVSAIASYFFLNKLRTSAYFEHRSQEFLGESYGVSTYGGSAGYEHKLFNGTINANVEVSGNSTDGNGGETVSFSTNENYTADIMGWNVNGSFGYGQNIQTLLVTYMNSSYSFGGGARRRWGHFSVGAGAGGARTALTEQAGSTSSSQSYDASVGYTPWIALTGNYSKSSGQAIITGAGLVPVPVPTPVVPSDLVSLYGGNSYSFGLGSSPVKRLSLSATYARSISDVTSSTDSSANENKIFNFLALYQFRKLTATTGFSRLEQGFSGSGTAPQVVSSFYIGVSRWFNFF